MISLTRSRHWPDTRHVADNDATGFSSSNIQGGQTAQCGFFTSVHVRQSFNGGLDGDTFGCAGGLVCRSANPIQFRHPRLAARGGQPLYKEANMASTLSLDSSCAILRASIHTPGFAESKFLRQHFAAMSRCDQLTILALVHNRALAEGSRRAKEAGRVNHVIVARKEAK